MRSVRRLLVVAAAMLALTLAVPSVSAASHKAFYLDKTCSTPVLCTVQHSDFQAIPKNTEITYAPGPASGLVYATITVKNGSTTGVCDWNQPGPVVRAKCTFDTGTGRLTQFHLAVDVTTDGPNWFWNGWYWFGGGD
jgi:hypothetical protein